MTTKPLSQPKINRTYSNPQVQANFLKNQASLDRALNPSFSTRLKRFLRFVFVA